MNSAIRASCFLLFFLVSQSSNLARAFENCTDDEVVKRVCAPSIVPDTSSFSCGTTYNRLDDTGYGKSVTDFVNPTDKNLSAKNALIVTDPAYEKFKRSFNRVKAAYLALIEQLPNSPKKDWMMTRWERSRLPEKRRMEESPQNSIGLGVNGYYRNARIQVMPIVVNYPNLSESELSMLIAHEMGHYFDPTFGSNKAEAKVFKIPACFFSARINAAGKTKDVDAEDFADWMAAQVAEALASENANETVHRARVMNSAYFFCETRSAFSRTVNRLLTEGTTNYHTANSLRIVALMKDPKMLSAISCGPQIINHVTKSPLPTCSLVSH